LRHSPLNISATGMEVQPNILGDTSLVRRCDDKRRLTDLYTSVRGAALLKASQRVVFKFRVNFNYRSHYY